MFTLPPDTGNMARFGNVWNWVRPYWDYWETRRREKNLGMNDPPTWVYFPIVKSHLIIVFFLPGLREGEKPGIRKWTTPPSPFCTYSRLFYAYSFDCFIFFPFFISKHSKFVEKGSPHE